MRPNNNHNNPRRMRGRSGGGGSGGGGGGGGNKNKMANRNQTFDSNGPEVRVRGNAHQIFEKYQALAREATAAGDRITAESYYQHAEHYFRVISALGGFHRPQQDWGDGEGEEQGRGGDQQHQGSSGGPAGQGGGNGGNGAGNYGQGQGADNNGGSGGGQNGPYRDRDFRAAEDPANAEQPDVFVPRPVGEAKE